MAEIEDNLINNWTTGRGFSLKQGTSPVWEESVIHAGSVPKALSKPLHRLFQGIGMTGIEIADAADALLYAIEGEYGEAALSASSMLGPVVGGHIAAKRALKAAKDGGEKFVTIYRGTGGWHRGKMVVNGNFVSGGSPASTRLGREGEFSPLYTTELKKDAKVYAKGYAEDSFRKSGSITNPKLLKFEVPESWINKNSIYPDGSLVNYRQGESMAPVHIFKEGLPKEFLVKVSNIDISKKNQGIINKLMGVFKSE